MTTTIDPGLIESVVLDLRQHVETIKPVYQDALKDGWRHPNGEPRSEIRTLYHQLQAALGTATRALHLEQGRRPPHEEPPSDDYPSLDDGAEWAAPMRPMVGPIVHEVQAGPAKVRILEGSKVLLASATPGLWKWARQRAGSTDWTLHRSKPPKPRGGILVEVRGVGS